MLRCLAPEKPIPDVCIATNSPSALMEEIQKRGDHKESSMRNKLLPSAASCMEGPWGGSLAGGPRIHRTMSSLDLVPKATKPKVVCQSPPRAATASWE